MTIQLTLQSPFINPFWLNKLRNNGDVISIVNDDLTINVYDEKLKAPDNSELKPGDQVFVWIINNIYCEKVSDREERDKKLLKKEQELEKLAKLEKERLRILKDDTTHFNNSLNIPFQWRTGHKSVLSGLLANSAGDGLNKATVGHVELLEDYQNGRLKRKKGEFLCSPNKGKQWSRDSHLVSYDENGLAYDAKVTCKACLKFIKKWKKKS